MTLFIYKIRILLLNIFGSEKRQQLSKKVSSIPEKATSKDLSVFLMFYLKVIMIVFVFLMISKALNI